MQAIREFSRQVPRQAVFFTRKGNRNEGRRDLFKHNAQDEENAPLITGRTSAKDAPSDAQTPARIGLVARRECESKPAAAVTSSLSVLYFLFFENDDMNEPHRSRKE